MTFPNILDGTEQFLTAAGHPIPDVPAIPAPETIALRLKLLFEEVEELVEAAGFGNIDEYLDDVAENDVEWTIGKAINQGRFNLPEYVDANHDIQVIAHGGNLEAIGRIGTTITADQVTQSNLSKIVDGKVYRRADGKIAKPPGWTPPNIKGALETLGWVEPGVEVKTA
ncbi:hypothetical protein CH289_07855 [Rhodococcus sp. RS1C4]|nr:hypothetical protein [Rhodococcus sp. RS1C4]OZC55096.1 hypothetical protein CH289_07855 [Rhodococcus sp. RS1C4]